MANIAELKLRLENKQRHLARLKDQISACAPDRKHGVLVTKGQVESDIDALVRQIETAERGQSGTQQRS